MTDINEKRVREIVRDELSTLHLSERLSVVEIKLDQKADKADLDKLEAKLMNEISFIKSDMVSVKSDMASVKSDIVSIKKKMTTVESDMASVKSKVASVQIELASFKEYSQNNFKFVVGFFITILILLIGIALK